MGAAACQWGTADCGGVQAGTPGPAGPELRGSRGAAARADGSRARRGSHGPLKPRLLEHYRVAVRAASETAVRRGARLQLRGETARRPAARSAGFVEHVVPLLDGQHTLERSRSESPASSIPDELERVLALPLGNRVVEDAETSASPPAPRSGSGRSWATSARSAPIPAEVSRPAGGGEVTVVGLGAVGAVAATALAAANVGRCAASTAPRSQPATRSSRSSSAVTTSAVAGRRCTRERIHAVSPATSVEVRRRVHHRRGRGGRGRRLGFRPRVPRSRARLDHLQAQPGVSRAADALVAATVSAFEGIVGPTVIPYETACYLCYQMRTVACADDPVDALAELRRADESRTDMSAVPREPPLRRRHRRQLLALEAFKALDGLRPRPPAGFSTSTSWARDDAACRSCASRGARRASRRATRDRAALSLTDLVDPRVGIVRSCTVVPRTGVSRPDRSSTRRRCRTSTSASAAARADRERKGPDRRRSPARRDRRGARALLRLQQRPARLSSAGERPRRDRSIAPEEFVLYSERQYGTPGFPLPEAGADDELTWVRGSMLGSGGHVYAPASLVYMNFVGAGGRELFTPTTSSGLAGGADLAVGRARRALRARRARRLHDRLAHPAAGASNRLRRKRRDRGSRSAALREVRDRDARVRPDDRSRDPRGDGRRVRPLGSVPAATVGLGCDLDPATALDRAVMEVVQVRTGSSPCTAGSSRPPESRATRTFARSRTTPRSPPTPSTSASSTSCSSGHRRGAGRPPRHGGRHGRGGSRALPGAARGRRLHGRLRRPHLPDVEPFGIRIVRAIATGLQPIHFGFGEERLGGRRLFAVPRLLGHDDRT